MTINTLNFQERIKSHRFLKVRDEQRLFFCGDVHGHLKELEKKLRAINFNASCDVLVFLGDLIDRGNYSADMIEFVCNTPNVYSVFGNHEFMFLASMHDELCRFIHCSPRNGGDWIEQYDEDKLHTLSEMLIKNLSTAITIEYRTKKIGVIHAKSPDVWDDIFNAEFEEQDEWVWSRMQFNAAKSGRNHFCVNIDFVVHGHVCDHKTLAGNHIWIDTLFQTGSLTVISAEELINEFHKHGDK